MPEINENSSPEKLGAQTKDNPNHAKIDFVHLSPFVRFVNYNSGPYYSYFIPKRVIYDYEMIYVSDGRLMVESQEGNYSIEQGEIHFMKPQIVHRRYVPQNEFCSYYNLHFDLKYTGEDFSAEIYTRPCEEKVTEVPIDEDLLNRMVYELSELELPVKMMLSDPARLIAVMEEMLRSFRGEEFGYQLVLTADLLKVLSLVAEEKKNENQSREFSYYSDQINKFTLHLLNHYHEKINLDAVARTLGISSTHLRKVFKSIEQKTPQEYLIDLRIEKAKEYIAEGKYSMTEISSMVGYDDIHYFSRIFKKREKLSPTEYLALCRGEPGQ